MNVHVEAAVIVTEIARLASRSQDCTCPAKLQKRPPLEVTDDDYPSTPLGWATYGSKNGWHRESGDYAGTVKALLRAGAAPPKSLDGSDEVRAVLEQ
jgi:hypothetical protein